jgi:hypothetical protein
MLFLQNNPAELDALLYICFMYEKHNTLDIGAEVRPAFKLFHFFMIFFEKKRKHIKKKFYLSDPHKTYIHPFLRSWRVSVYKNKLQRK